MTLDPDPERTVTIPITKANQGTASDADYSGVPANVVFGPDELRTFMVRATDDAIDDDGESVQLGFGVLPIGCEHGRHGHQYGQHHRQRRSRRWW